MRKSTKHFIFSAIAAVIAVIASLFSISQFSQGINSLEDESGFIITDERGEELGF